MRLLQSPNADMKALSIVAPIVKGGTGADNSTEAVQNLGGLNAASLGQANGIAKLNAQGKLDLTVFPNMVMVGPTLNGPTVVYTGQTVDYTITNYDIKTTYEVSASVGSLTRSGDTISYTAPGTTGPLVLTVNNKVANVSIESTSPIAPSITSPVTGSTNLSASVSVSATVFAMNTGADTHLSSDWQVATDNAFQSVISSTVNDTVNKNSWTATGLSPNTTYYARVRYKGTVSGYGPWSASISFTTKANFLPDSEIGVLASNDLSNADRFGWSISMNSDGSRAIIGAYLASYEGKAYIFSRSGTTWTQEAILTGNDFANEDYFGFSVSMDSTGSRVTVGTPISSTNGGKAYIFSRSGTTWTQEAKLVASDATISNYFGGKVSISGDGTRVVVGAQQAVAGGKAYIFSRSGTTWTQEAILTQDQPGQSGDSFGNYVAIDSSGTRAVVSRVFTTTEGRIFIFVRSGTTWTQEARITITNYSASNQYASAISISSDCSRLVVGGYGADSLTGKAYIYVRSGTTWTQEAVLTASGGAAGDQFGLSVSMNSDGSKVFIGAPTVNVNGTANTGKTYVFSRSIYTWTQAAVLIPSSISGDEFGRAVSISGDGTKGIVGAPYGTLAGMSNTNTGKVYMYS